MRNSKCFRCLSWLAGAVDLHLLCSWLTRTQEPEEGGEEGGGEEPIVPMAVDDEYSVLWRTGPFAPNNQITDENVLDNDVAEFPLTVTISTSPDHAEVFEQRADGGFTYRPEKEFFGDDSWTYTCDDGNGWTGNATVTVHVVKSL